MKNNRTITTSAPGKLLLMGDHAVVYGRPCIVTAIDHRLYATTTEKNEIVGDTRFVDAAVAAWGEGKNIAFSTRSSFSGKYGFGSSSAVTVATLKAIRPDATNEELFQAAYTIVLDIQGMGSGFDIAAAIYGGTLYFKTGGVLIENMSVGEIPIIVGYSGVKADTSQIVKNIAQKREKESEKVERIFDAIGTLVDESKPKILEGDWERVGKLMDFNQEYLRDLGVSTQKLEAMIQAAKKAGAWGAKLSGAGGGDCMIAVGPSDKRTAIEQAIFDAGGEVVTVRSGAMGVRVETTDDQGEMLIVVDEHDQIIGYKTRYECHHNPTLMHRTVGVILTDDQGRVLLQKRSATKDMESGLWGISAAGHVTKGQTDDEAIHREMQEELGVDTEVMNIGSTIIQTFEESERSALYKGIHNGPFSIHTEEVEKVEFLTVGEIQQRVQNGSLPLTRAAQIALQKIGVLL